MNSNVKNAVRYALMAGAILSLSAPTLYAQDAAQSGAGNQNQDQNANVKLGKIDVTGTAIPRTSVEPLLR